MFINCVFKKGERNAFLFNFPPHWKLNKRNRRIRGRGGEGGRREGGEEEEYKQKISWDKIDTKRDKADTR